MTGNNENKGENVKPYGFAHYGIHPRPRPAIVDADRHVHTEPTPITAIYDKDNNRWLLPD